MANQTFQINFYGHDGAGNSLINTWHVTIDDTGTVLSPFEQANNVRIAFDSAIRVDWLALMPTDYMLDYLSCKRVTGGGSPTSVDVPGPGPSPGIWAMTSAISSAGLQLAMIPGPGNNSIGKSFLPCVPADAIVESRFTGAYETAAAVIQGALLTNLTVTGFSAAGFLSIFHRALGTFNAVFAIELRVKPGVQRKRLTPVY